MLCFIYYAHHHSFTFIRSKSWLLCAAMDMRRDAFIEFVLAFFLTFSCFGRRNPTTDGPSTVHATSVPMIPIPCFLHRWHNRLAWTLQGRYLVHINCLCIYEAPFDAPIGFCCVKWCPFFLIHSCRCIREENEQLGLGLHPRRLGEEVS